MMLTSALAAAHIHLARRRNAASIERSRDAGDATLMWPCSEALAAGGRRAGDLRPVAALTGGATHSGQGSGAKTNSFDVRNVA